MRVKYFSTTISNLKCAWLQETVLETVNGNLNGRQSFLDMEPVETVKSMKRSTDCSTKSKNYLSQSEDELYAVFEHTAHNSIKAQPKSLLCSLLK